MNDKIKNLKEILDLVNKPYFSVEDGTKLFATLIKLVKDLKEENNSKYAEMINKVESVIANHKSISKDTEFSTTYFKNEITGLKKVISNLKLKHGKDGRDADPVDTDKLATEASEIALEATKELIQAIPPITKDLPKYAGIYRDALETLKDEDRLDASAIKNLPESIEKHQTAAFGVREAPRDGKQYARKDRSWVEVTNGASDHNDLDNIQGGTTDEYYHLTASDYTDLGDLLHPYVAASAVLSTTPATGLREFGNTATDVALSAVTTKGTNNITSVKFYRGATLIETVASPIAGGGTETFTDTTDLETTTTYTCKVGDGTQETTSNAKTFTFVYPYYYGVGDPDLTASAVAGLTKAVVASGTKTYSFSPSSQVYYFAYPASYGTLSSIKDPNGFPITTDWTLRVENITGLDGNPVSYNIYEFNNLTTQTGFAITFTL